VNEETKKPGRKLGFFMAVALVMGNMIGSGVFLLPASLAPFGWNAVAGWVITIAGAMCLAWIFARLMAGTALGPVDLVEEEFGRIPGFLIGFSLWVYVWAGIVTISIAAISYGSSFVPWLGQHPVPSTLVVIWALTLLNIAGTRSAGAFQLVTTIVKIIPLIVVMILIAWAVTSGSSATVPPLSAEGISLGATNQAAAITLWAMLGFESACLAAARVSNPKLTIPRATMLGAGLTGLIYLVVCSGIALMLPANLVTNSNAPFELFVSTYWSSGPAAWIAAFAAISALGAVNGWILLQGEVPREMAARGMMPKTFARTTAQGTPAIGLIISSILASLLLFSNSSRTMSGLFTYTALLTTSVALWLYLAASLVALKRGIARPVAVIGIIFCLWSLWGAGWDISLLSILIMLAGLPLYWWARRSLPKNEVSAITS
jgi:basic amino acid/polyamine antiporter, APA family